MNTLSFKRHALALSLALAAFLPSVGHAHRAWLLPGSTVLSGAEPWVTVDAGVSTDPFVLDHNALKLDGLVITGPEGSAVKPENLAQGKLRNVFDLKLSQKGTYKIAVVTKGVNATYKQGGEVKRWRGTEETLAKEVPANAQDLVVTRSLSRVETFVTSGKPNDKALQPSGQGLELVPITHPNDLFVGDEAKFRFLLDGQPATGLEVTLIPGGARYRSNPNEVRVTTDAQGQFSVKWPSAGMFYVTASVGGGRPEGMGGAATAPAKPAAPAQRRASYAATFEILSQ